LTAAKISDRTLRVLQARVAGLVSAQPRPGRPSMAERRRMGWANVPPAERSRRMRDLANKRWHKEVPDGEQ